MTDFLRINRMARGEARIHKKYSTIVHIVLGMGCLLEALATAPSYLSGVYESLQMSITAIGLLLIGACIGPTGIISIFRDLSSPQFSDVQMSLPISAKQRFFSKLLALGYVHIFPVMGWGFLTWVFCLIKDAEHAGTYFTLYLILVVIALFFDSVAVMCAVCCGRRSETRYFTYLAVICLSFTPLLIRAKLMEEYAGQTSDPSLLFSCWTLAFVAAVTDVGFLSLTFKVILIINCLISLAVMSLMYFVYRNRDATSAGKPVTNRIFFESLMFVGVVTFFVAVGRVSISMTILLGIAYLVVHIVTFRGMLSADKVILWIGKYVGTMALYMLLSWIAYQSNGFGAVYSIPSKNLDGACISIELLSYEMNSCNAEGYAGPRGHYLRDGRTLAAPREINDEQMRKVIRTVQKYFANREKSYDRFCEKAWTRDMFDIGIYDVTARCEIVVWFPDGPEDEYSSYKKNIVMTQELELSSEELGRLLAELREQGLIDIYSYPY